MDKRAFRTASGHFWGRRNHNAGKVATNTNQEKYDEIGACLALGKWELAMEILLRARRWVASLALMSAALVIAACGGGSDPGPSTPTLPPPTALSYASPQTYTVGVPITPLKPTVTGTVTSYSIAPSLPAGLSIDAATGEISGTPTAAAATTCTVTALNSSGSATFQVSITVTAAATGFYYSSPQTYVVGVPITPLNPTANGALANFTVSPALPGGLALDSASGQITGTPTSVSATANYLITAQGSTGAVTFLLSITVIIPPPSGLSYPGPNTFTVGVAIAPLKPTVTGTVTSYSVAPALPAGLTLNSTTGEISGAPGVASIGTNYLVTAANGSGIAVANLYIVVLIPAPSALSYPSPQVYTATVASAPLMPIVTGTVTYYSVSPSLPLGLVIDSTSGQISGTPTTATATSSYVISAANSSGATDFTLSITVLVAPPSALSYRSPQTFTVGVPIVPLNPSVTSTVASYSSTPALPAGLTLNAASGQISGTPTAAVGASNYTIRASNSSGSTTFSLSIQVLLLPPRALSYPSPQRLAVGLPMAPLKPFVVGLASNYSVAPALPAGLSIGGSSGQIAGTPAAVSATSNYVITATNAAGSTSFTLSLSVESVGVSPAHIARIAAVGTPVTVQLTVASATFPANGPVYSVATDPSGVLASNVVVTPIGNSRYTFNLTLSTSTPAGAHSGFVSLALCGDAACTVVLPPASITLPYDVTQVSSTSTWPGNNLLPLAPWQSAPDWGTFQGNAAHTGYVPVDVDPNSFSTRWQGPTLNNVYQYTPTVTTLTTGEGRIFVAYNNALYALKELDASQVWQYSFATLVNPSVNPPAVADGTVYMVAGQQGSTTLFAFNAPDGALVFRSQMASQWEHYLAPTIGPQGIYTNAGTYGGLYGFGFSGEPLFFAGLAQQSGWTPAADATHVYAYTGDSLTLFNPVSGSVDAQITDPSFQNYIYQIGGSAVLGSTGSVFAAAYYNSFLNGGGIGNKLLHFNTNTKAISWQFSGDYPTTPAYEAGVVYAANNNPLRLEARDETAGTLLWSWTPPLAGDSNFTSEVMLTNTMAFVSTNLNVYGIDLLTHNMVWSYPFPGSLSLSQNGILYIQGVGPLIAINVK